MSVVYVDSSAFVKLITPEAESESLRGYLHAQDYWISASLLRAEVLRAALRSGSPERLAAARQQLRHVAYVDVTRELMDQTGAVQPADVRTLDAVHLTAALSLADDLDRLITYDERMARAATANGLPVAAPR